VNIEDNGIDGIDLAELEYQEYPEGLITPILYTASTIPPNKVVDIATSYGAKTVWLISEDSVYLADNGYIFYKLYQMPAGVTLTSVKHFTKNTAFLLGYNEKETSTLLYTINTAGDITLRHTEISQHYKADSLCYTDIVAQIPSAYVIYNKVTTQEIIVVNVRELEDLNNENLLIPAWSSIYVPCNQAIGLPVPGKIKKLFTDTLANYEPADEATLFFKAIFSIDSQYYYDTSSKGGKIYPSRICALRLFASRADWSEGSSTRAVTGSLSSPYYLDPPRVNTDNNQPGIYGVTDLLPIGNLYISIGYEKNNIEDKFNGTYFMPLGYGGLPIWQDNIQLLCMICTFSRKHLIFSSNTENLYYVSGNMDFDNYLTPFPTPQPLPIKSNTFGSVANTKKLCLYQERKKYVSSFYGITEQNEGFLYINPSLTAISDLIEMYDRKYIIGISPDGEIAKCDLSRGNYWTKKNISEAIYSKSLHNINCKTAISGLCHDGKTNV
jgi:hypothetical protein